MTKSLTSNLIIEDVCFEHSFSFSTVFEKAVCSIRVFHKKFMFLNIFQGSTKVIVFISVMYWCIKLFSVIIVV